jgi:hypothetical protein
MEYRPNSTAEQGAVFILDSKVPTEVCSPAGRLGQFPHNIIGPINGDLRRHRLPHTTLKARAVRDRRFHLNNTFQHASIRRCWRCLRQAVHGSVLNV